VAAPTLLIVGGNNTAVISMNEDAMQQLITKKKLEIVPGASHLLEEAGKLQEVAKLAGAWFHEHLGDSSQSYNVQLIFLTT